jgi:Phage integrase, N-terminal SAM-like domain
VSAFPCLVRSSPSGGEARVELGDPLVDSYLGFVAGRARANTLRAVAHDLKTFFGVVDKDPAEVVAADVFDFLAHQRGDRTVVRISDGESGLSARTIARRLSSISGLYAYLVARGDTPVRANPVPRGLLTRRRGGRRQQVPAGAGAAHAPEDPPPSRGQRAHRRAAHPPGPGDGVRHGAGRTTSLRGPGPHPSPTFRSRGNSHSCWRKKFAQASGRCASPAPRGCWRRCDRARCHCQVAACVSVCPDASNVAWSKA